MRLLSALEFVGEFQEAVGGPVRAIENDVLDRFAQNRVDFVVDLELPCVDDCHVEPGTDRVVQEHRMDGLPDAVLAPE